MANFMSNPSQKAQLGYNGFDMSHLLKFTSTTGELRPIFKDLLSPGDKITASAQLKTRTKDIQSSAMCNINQYIDWFFVPITQIYTAFEQFYTRVGHPSTSLMDDTQQQITNYFPFVNANAGPLWVAGLVSHDDAYFPEITGTRVRIADDLGFPASYLGRLEMQGVDFTNKITPFPVNPMFACAYQKIYHDYYMLEDRESIPSSYWNLDKYWNTVTAGNIDQVDFTNYFTLRYRPYKKDFFTHQFVSPLMGSSSIGAANLQSRDVDDLFHQWLIDTGFQTGSPNGGENTEDPTSLIAPFAAQSVATLKGQLSRALSPDSLRTSFALQKLLEVTRRSGKNYDSQILAHFGVKVPEGVDGKVVYLGTQKNNINIGDVISTAATSDANLGQVGGKGYGFVDGSPIKFEAKTFGILMAIYSAVPDVDYDDTRAIEKTNRYIDRADWYTPEFDNLGMQPIFRYQSSVEIDGTIDANTIMGWQYRWSELKCKYNRVIGGLAIGRGLDFWTLQRFFGYEVAGQTPLTHFLCSPNTLDPIMYAPYHFVNADWEETTTFDPAYEADPLFHECYFDVKKASKMSTYGLQQL